MSLKSDYLATLDTMPPKSAKASQWAVQRGGVALGAVLGLMGLVMWPICPSCSHAAFFAALVAIFLFRYWAMWFIVKDAARVVQAVGEKTR